MDIAESGARLRVDRGRLLIETDSSPTPVAFSDLAAVILVHPAITCTRPVLSALAEAGVPVIVCDDRSLPVAMLWPLTGYHAPAQRLRAQVGATLPTRKRIWQRLVRAKITEQAAALTALRGDDAGLAPLARQVRSGDPTNIEAQAARRYWPRLFDDPQFQRRPGQPDQNRYLNYGYAVARAIITRAICASGLHPGLGVHHHHRGNPFCLADDLIEPFRPIVDQVVVAVVDAFGPDAPMDRRTKAALLEFVTLRWEWAGVCRTAADHAAALAASVAFAFEGRKCDLPLPGPAP